MKKPVFYTELAWLVGLWLLAWGTALTAWTDLGISMLVAPAYVLHLAMVKVWDWFSFAVGEYVLQTIILIMMMLILRKVRIRYFLSFLAAILYGLLLALGIALTDQLLPVVSSLPLQIFVYILGDLGICLGVALMIRTYLPPEVYEMFVIEIAKMGNFRIGTVKTLYDCGSLLVAVIMSLALLGKIEGVGIATLICALLNGFVIEKCGIFFDRFWDFRNLLKFKKRSHLYE